MSNENQQTFQYMQDFLKGYSENPLIADLNPSLPIFESVKDGIKARIEDEYNRIQNNRVALIPSKGDVI